MWAAPIAVDTPPVALSASVATGGGPKGSLLVREVAGAGRAFEPVDAPAAVAAVAAAALHA